MAGDGPVERLAVAHARLEALGLRRGLPAPIEMRIGKWLRPPRSKVSVRVACRGTDCSLEARCPGGRIEALPRGHAAITVSPDPFLWLGSLIDEATLEFALQPTPVPNLVALLVAWSHGEEGYVGGGSWPVRVDLARACGP